MERGKVLKRAHILINGERRTMYGAPEDSFGVIANFWRDYILGKFGVLLDLDKYDIALMMVLMKMAREIQGYKDDNWVDMAGYIGLGGDFREIDENKASKTTTPVGDTPDKDSQGTIGGVDVVSVPWGHKTHAF